MKIIFFGSSDFAVPALEALNDEKEVVLVVTQPDRKKGRSMQISSTPVKRIAERFGIKTFQPDKLNCEDSIEYLRKFDAEIFIVVSFGEILSKEILDIPKFHSLNAHASLLPKYRGAAPINWAIANAEKETGVTVIKMNEKIDEGEVLLKESVPIDINEDAIRLSKKLSGIASLALLKSIDLIEGKKADFVKQDSREATYGPKLKKEDGLIDWQWSAEKIYNRIRAFVPWPGCFTYWNKKILKIWKAAPDGESASAPRDPRPGTVIEVTGNAILVATGSGRLRIEELQLESKRRMKVEEFIAGRKEMASGSMML